MQRTHFLTDHQDYRQTVREFLVREIEPNYSRREEDRLTDRAAYVAAGKSGILGLAIPEEIGGAGVTDYRFRQVLTEELARIGASSFRTSLDVMV